MYQFYLFMELNHFRQHQGGVHSVIRFANVFLLLGLLVQLAAAIIAIVTMFSNEINLNVVANYRTGDSAMHRLTGFSALKTMGMLNFEAQNLIQWLLLPRHSEFDVYNIFISLAVTWQLYRIFKDINVLQPFYGGILKRIIAIRQLIFIGIVFSIARYAYLFYIVRNVGNGQYQLLPNSYLTSFGYFTFGTWIIVYLFAHVYKKGVVLQRENELTI